MYIYTHTNIRYENESLEEYDGKSVFVSYFRFVIIEKKNATIIIYADHSQSLTPSSGHS